MYKLAIIGVGKMGSAILKGLLLSNKYSREEILLIVHHEEQKLKFEREGYSVSLNPQDAFLNAAMILLAVKPQKFPEALQASGQYDYHGRAVLSIAAGISLARLSEYFPGADVIRAMPNTGAEIQKSVTTLCASKKNEHYNKAKDILEAIGKVVEIEEAEMDSTLPLNGSMPAYLYYFISSFIKAAVDSGVDENKAKDLLVSTIISSSEMLLSSTEEIDTLIKNVCSKGGTTIAGLNKLTDAKMSDSIHECYDACKERSIELSK